MGHTFCAPPTSPSRKPLPKHTPRSSGVPGNWSNWGRSLDEKDSRNLKKICELHEDSRYLGAIRDVLGTEPPPINTNHANRRSKSLKVFSQTGRSSSRQLKQMLLSRHSSSPQPVTSCVARRTTRDGKRYAQIVYGRGDPSVCYGQGYDKVDKSIAEVNPCGNPSVYRVNECKDMDGKFETKIDEKKRRSAWSKATDGNEEKATALTNPQSHGKDQGQLGSIGSLRKPFLDPIEQSDDNEPYNLGIADEYMLPTAEDKELSPDPGHETFLPRSAGLGPADNSKDGNLKPSAFPRLSFRSKVSLGQHDSNTVSNYSNPVSDESNGNRTSLRITKKPSVTRSHTLGPEAASPYPPPLKVASELSYLPKSPRNSMDEKKRELQVSPKYKGRAQARSSHSTSDSMVDDGRSETSIGNPMEARSAEVVRAGYHSRDFHKFPRPGPAPTGALPSLPEGHDSRTSIVILPSVGLESANALPSCEPSPMLPSPRSPTKRYRYRPLDNVVNNDTAKSLAQTKQPDLQTPPFPGTEDPKELDQEEPSGKASVSRGGKSPDPAPTSFTWREQRAQSRKELKLRDLDRLHSRGALVDVAQATAGRAESEGFETTSKSDVRQSYSSPALLASGRTQTPQKSSSNTAEERQGCDPGPLNALSPILVVVEQKPSASKHSSTTPNGSLRNGKRSSRSYHSHKEAFQQPGAQSPSFPSSDEDSTRCAHRTRIHDPRRHSHAQTASTLRSSVAIQDLEARFEIRLAELERKNTLLLNAFVAVINTPAEYTPSPQVNVDRLSSLSGRTSSGPSWHRSSGQSSGRDGHLVNVNGKYAPCPEMAAKEARKASERSVANSKIV